MLLDSPGIALTAQGQALEAGAHRRAHPGAQPGVARGGRGRGDRAGPGAREHRAARPATASRHDEADHGRVVGCPCWPACVLSGCGSLTRLSEVGRAAVDDADADPDQGSDLAADDACRCRRASRRRTRRTRCGGPARAPSSRISARRRSATS